MRVQAVGGREVVAAQAVRREVPAAEVVLERTSNICHMLVTLDVSKLSGWLNALAPCRGSKGGHAVQG